MRMWWWGDSNFGDLLGPVVVAGLTGRRPVRTKRPPRLLTCGSILMESQPGDVVWGSGIHGTHRPTDDLSGRTILAVRGPITRQWAQRCGASCPELYGDPASLLPEVYCPPTVRKRDLLAITHYGDRQGLATARRLRLPVMPTSRLWREIVDAIASSGMVLSSSLHGLIVSEAYGVPAVWMQFSPCREKYQGYYLATGREPPDPTPWGRDVEPPPRPRSLCGLRFKESLVSYLESENARTLA